VSGRRGASLEAGILTVYTLEGAELKSTELGPSGAQNLLISPVGDILLLYSDHARWYTDNGEVIE
jgi:hypothetical protein